MWPIVLTDLDSFLTFVMAVVMFGPIKAKSGDTIGSCRSVHVANHKNE